ncbi:L [Anopheles B virus]|uniref:RNA-directed RNA polymerase L n=1 Tax=Anopheles B virus TaxID=35308 RepID=A0A7D9MVR8_9VIRU|nr:L [Anopheles B virus] [Anopheles B virus]QLA46998.1 L [Anopheles B virus] [Anopheles B virus]
MDRGAFREFRARINAASTADVAKDIDVDLLIARHNYFGRIVCEAYDIEYRNDVPLVDILLNCLDDFDPLEHKIPNITPDNYIFHEGILFLIDYKVTLSMETVNLTIEKYTKISRDVSEKLSIPIEVVIIQINPRTKEVYISNDFFKNIFGVPLMDPDFDDFFALKDMLYTKFESDEEFLLKVSHGDFTLTTPWIDEDTEELFTDEIFDEFISSMPGKYQKLFYESIDHSAYSSERWNTQLYKIKNETQAEYDTYVKSMAHNVFICTGQYSKPSKTEIKKGWDIMSKRIQDTRNVHSSAASQKPSIHTIWSPPDMSKSNENIKKILRLSKLLQNLNGQHPMTDVLRQLGECFDFSENPTLYELITNKRKEECRRSSKQITNKKIEPYKIGKADVLWEQQFSLNNDVMGKDEKKRLLKDYCGIGGHRNFSNKTEEETNLSKPDILDFNSEEIYLASIEMMNKTKSILSEDSGIDRKNYIIDEFGDKILNANPETFQTVERILRSKYWSFVTDYSTLIKNLLSLSEYNRANTFRIATCANNSLFGILMPSSDIKTKKSTIVYFIVAIHKKDDLVDPGALSYTYKSGDMYISVSRAMRLDKERCQRIVSSPGLFLMSTILMYNNNHLVDLNDVMNFCLYTSLSITKALLSLTEPSRYMIMNSLAISSDVKGYIAEKFSPYTKTLFSVYMTRLIRKACFQAYDQRSKIGFREICLTDYDITQKGVKEDREIMSIWFKGLVSIKEYLNQIYMPFYFNAKGLHEKHHVMIDLLKTVGEIELEQRENIKEIWSEQPKPQTVNLPVYLHSLSKSLITDTSRHNHLRNKIESRNNFKRSPTTVSTFTSSKSSVKIGNFKDQKIKAKTQQAKIMQSQDKKFRLANPVFFQENDLQLQVKHANYEKLLESVPNYIDYITTKNFDRLYELYKEGSIDDENTIQICLRMMKEHKDHYFAIFNKGQKTAKDREIFEPQWETKCCMYLVERLSKERCKLNLDEMISEPGDSKLKILEQKAEYEIRYMMSKQRELSQNDTEYKYKSIKIEINADMTKWSAQDVFYKYFWLIALDPVLYPKEKRRIVYFMCRYMQKSLIIPDEVMCSLLDQRINRPGDIFFILTDNFSKNHFKVKRNWLQGNFNYTSSYVHSCAMAVFKDIIKETAKLLQGDAMVNSSVHSDDNQTSIVIVQNIMTEDIIIEHVIGAFKTTCLSFGCQVNFKKTYFTNFIKEFVSLFNLIGEPFSIYGRFLLTCVGDCAYIGPYEDLSSRISATQSAIKHGCPPSYAWVSIALSHWITYLTYNMLPGQKNDPLPYFNVESRKELPIELFGALDADLSIVAMCGMESQNLKFLVNTIQKMSGVLKKKDPIISQISNIDEWDLSKLTHSEILKFKILRFLVLDTENTSDSMGETSDMRSRSLLTPRKFTTSGSMKRLISYNDYQKLMADNEGTKDLLDYVVENPELTITKGETKEEFMAMVLFRYNSKRFKESLSIQNPAQLFIEQILFSSKPIIDYERLKERFITLSDTLAVENFDTISGKVTFTQAYFNLNNDLEELDLSNEDIKTVYMYCLANDPLLTTLANSIVLSAIGAPMNRNNTSACTMPEFRNMKLIHHSPALVLKAYSKKRLDLPGANIEEMERDILHLENFIEETSLRVRMEKRLEEFDPNDEIQYKMMVIREKTRFYQVCYEYIKSAEHKIKVFILPMKTRTTHDFCSVVQGNLIHDNQWHSMHYLKQVVVHGHKAIISKAPTNDFMIAAECLRLLAFFIDSFVNENFKVAVLREIVETYKYKNLPVDNLVTIIAQSQQRHEFIPILYRLNLLDQRDLDKYDAMRASEKITWSANQVNREYNTGPIDLTISGYNRELRILGDDDKLHVAELQLSTIRMESIMNSGRALLRSRHGLRIEKMQKCEVESNNLYITYQRKTHNTYVYQIHTTESILSRNQSEIKGRFFNEIVPVCPVVVSQYIHRGKLLLKTIKYLNQEKTEIGRVKISDTESIMMKRALLDKMKLFEGPDINIGLLSINKLMSTTELMTLDYSKISSVSYITLASILVCEGSTPASEDFEEFEFTGLSDDSVEEQSLQDIECSPMLDFYISRRTQKGMSYKNAVKEAIKRESERFNMAFDFTSTGFYSSKNLGILSVLVSLMNLLETNEWSTLLNKCIHFSLILKKMDAIYHNFELPRVFFTDPVKYEVNWPLVKSFLIELAPILDPLWSEMFEHFKYKSLEIINKKMTATIDMDQILSSIAIEGGIGDFEFK